MLMRSRLYRPTGQVGQVLFPNEEIIISVILIGCRIINK